MDHSLLLYVSAKYDSVVLARVYYMTVITRYCDTSFRPTTPDIDIDASFAGMIGNL
jgi:hypothetical protein